MRRIGFAALVVRALVGSVPAQAATPSLADNPVQFLADMTLIDAECRDVRVMFGAAFQSVQQHGFPVASIMPTGPLRSSFEEAYRTRFTETSHEDLCGELVRLYQGAFPGLLAEP